MTKNFVAPHPLPNTPDERLIESVLQGDKASFDLLMQKHQTQIFAMVHRHLRQRQEAEDVVQRVFLQAYENLGKFRGESKFFTWLYTIALNLIRNHVRQRNLRRMDSLDASRKTDDRPAQQWPEISPSPDKIVQDRWDLERVKSALENLKDVHRVIFTLHYFQHLSLKEVAVRVKRPVGTVKVYLHRARIMIINQLEKQDMSNKDHPDGL